jgi:hypothetical protein
MKKLLSLSNITLLVALSLSTVAAYYSIIGLTAIFAGAVIPIIIMGSILEVGKITTTVWLRKYWHRASLTIKMYLVPAVILLAFLTSMGIFGFLSKAHTDQSMISGDVISKISVYDEKIKTARENIDANRKALKQMDEAVDQVMGRSQDEKGADKAVALRRGQTKERTRLLSEITAEQKVITQLSEERAPIAAEVRKVEAEVGPIKYIAAFIYGDNPDTNLLEAAVRWVIILIVIVFDPLAIALVLAANSSRKWDEEEEIIPLPVAEVDEKPTVEDLKPEIEKPVEEVKKSGMTFVDPGEHPQDQFDMVVENKVTDIELPEPSELPKIEPEKSILEQHPYLTAGFDHFKHLEPMVYKPATNIDNVDITNDELEATASSDIRISSDPVFKEVSEGYVIYDGKMISKDALKEMKPQLFKLTADSGVPVSTSFGTQFPRTAHKGDTFIRVDTLPNRVFKFDGKRWFEINKDTVDAYLYDENYIKYLIAKIDNGEYDLDLLSDKEKEQIEHYLNSSK